MGKIRPKLQMTDSAIKMLLSFMGRQLLLLSIIWVVPAALCAADIAGAGETPARDTQTIVDPYPLRPPDTSSPRDTLKSFLEHADYVVKAWQQGAVDARGFRNLVNAVKTMDFSTTPNSEIFTLQIERMLLLKELLDRIELPPAGRIPGEAEVAKLGITKWTIPNTRITISQIKDGLRAGEFVFSAATVEVLDAFYRLAKDLPYKSTATTPGIYESFIASRVPALDETLRNRLVQADASSPRSTLVGFLDSINQAHGLLQDADARLKAKPAQISGQEVMEIEAIARTHLIRAVNLLDLRKLPEAYRKDSALEAALQLKEVLDRTFLPFLEAVPDARMVEAARKRGAVTSEGYRWRYPNTEIEIVEVMEGERRGQFLFSTGTVLRAREFYEKVRDLPYRSNAASADWRKYEWSGESKGIYEQYISSPGYLVPQAYALGRLIDALPSSLKAVYGEQTLWQWIALFLCLLATTAAGVIVFRVTKYISDRFKGPMRAWVMLLAPVLAALIVLQILEFVDTGVNITGRALHFVVALGETAVGILAVWAVFRASRAVSETFVSMTKIREGSHDASMVSISARILAFLSGCLIVIYSLRNLGADMIPLLAGLGVGGLAIALAAQRTFANFIGSLILFANKPVRVGDFCRYGDQIGTVEHIGLLATRIRSLERTIITVPNAEFSEMKIDNFAVRDQRLLKTVLQLRYETTSEQMRYVLARLRKLLLGHPKVTPSPARVRFVGYGAYSKDVEVFAYLDCEDQDTFLAIQEDILLRMEDVVNEAGSGFAFPSQTTYLTRDKGVDTGRQNAAVTEVENWRKHGRLPFPEFDSGERDQLENILDYPPKGSPEYVPPKAAYVTQAKAKVPTLSMDDLADLPRLVAKLRGKNRVAEYLQRQLSEETRTLLSEYDGGRDMELKEALVHDLNAVILGPAIYEEKRFSDIDLREQTQDLLVHELQGEELAWLNRFLLEDAFPRAFAVNPEL